MKNLMNLALTLMVAFSASILAGCSFGDSHDEQNKQELQDREKLMQNFSRVIGEYKGQIETPGKTVTLEATIGTVDEESGKNSNGETRFLPVLKIRYRQLDTVRPDLIMNARYFAEDGSINAAEKVSAGTGTGDGTVSNGTTLRGTVSGETISGTIYKNSGILGHFEMVRTDVAPQSPIANPEVDYNNRLRALYGTIAGRYEGQVLPSDPTKEPLTMKISIFSYDSNENGKFVPVLAGSILMNTDENVVLGHLNLSYQLEYTPALLNMIAVGTDTRYFFSATGTLENGIFKGEVSRGDGYTGAISLKKIIKVPAQNIEL